jgi:hypothetical protein
MVRVTHTVTQIYINESDLERIAMWRPGNMISELISTRRSRNRSLYKSPSVSTGADACLFLTVRRSRSPRRRWITHFYATISIPTRNTNRIRVGSVAKSTNGTEFFLSVETNEVKQCRLYRARLFWRHNLTHFPSMALPWSLMGETEARAGRLIWMILDLVTFYNFISLSLLLVFTPVIWKIVTGCYDYHRNNTSSMPNARSDQYEINYWRKRPTIQAQKKQINIVTM